MGIGEEKLLLEMAKELGGAFSLVIVCGILIYKEIKTFLASKSQIKKENLQTSVMREMRDIILDVKKYLEALSISKEKVITKDQSEVIIECVLDAKINKIVEFLKTILTDNNLQVNKLTIISNINIFFQTLDGIISNKLANFVYKDRSLKEILFKDYLLSVKNNILDVLFVKYENTCDKKGCLNQKINDKLTIAVSQKINFLKITLKNKL